MVIPTPFSLQVEEVTLAQLSLSISSIQNIIFTLHVVTMTSSDLNIITHTHTHTGKIIRERH